jgi:hypothetical protein
MHGDVVEAFIDVHNRIDDVNTDFIARFSTEDVIPQLLAFLLRPGRGALVHREDEWRDGAQDLEGLGFGGFHENIS